MVKKSCPFKTDHCGDLDCGGRDLVEWMAKYNSNEHQVARLATAVNSKCERR